VLPLNFNQANFNTAGSGAILSPATGPFNVFVTPRNFATPYVQNFNLNLQQQLSDKAAVEIGYVGSKGTRLTRLLDANQPDQFGNRPKGAFGFEDVLATISSSTYNSLQLSVNKRFTGGLLFGLLVGLGLLLKVRKRARMPKPVRLTSAGRTVALTRQVLCAAAPIARTWRRSFCSSLATSRTRKPERS